MTEAKQAAAQQLSSEHWAIIVVTGLLAAFLLSSALGEGSRARKTPVTRKAGTVLDVSITLVTADVSDLACASDAEVDGARCAFDSSGAVRDGVPAQPGTDPAVLAPYMTTDNVLFLVPGLFAEPAVAKRLAAEPPKGSRESLERFEASCRLKLVGKVDELAVRWEPGQSFSPRTAEWVGRVSGCTIKN